ncbi:MAG: cobalamin biosynthesis protein [Cyanobacteria bacterium P01_A01_bin.37]
MMVISFDVLGESHDGSPVIILAIAALLDALIGDPWNWPHPVQVMGWFIQNFVNVAQRITKNSLALRLLGKRICGK